MAEQSAKYNCKSRHPDFMRKKFAEQFLNRTSQAHCIYDYCTYIYGEQLDLTLPDQ